MELKNIFVQDTVGNVIPSPTAHLYQPGTTAYASGLKNKDGADLANPFAGSDQGLLQFAAPDGEYDLRVTSSVRDFTMRVRFVDAAAQVATATAAAASASDSAAAAAASAAAAAVPYQHLPSGTVSAPGVAFDQDSDTGFHRPAANTLVVVTGGSERMRFSDTGGVGIGTSSLSSYRLRIAGNITGVASGMVAQFGGTFLPEINSNAFGLQTLLNTAATSSLANLYHIAAGQATLGAGSSIFNQFGFHVPSSFIGGTNNFGFRSEIPAGTGRWNTYMSGTAANYMAGGLSVGTSVDAGAGNIRASSTIRPGSFTVATLPSASAVGAGAQAYVTDSSATTYRAIVAGGGSNKITVVSDGTNWLIGA